MDVPAADLCHEPLPVPFVPFNAGAERPARRFRPCFIARNTRDAYVHKASERQEENMHRLMVKLVRKNNSTKPTWWTKRLESFVVQTDTDRSKPSSTSKQRFSSGPAETELKIYRKGYNAT